MRGWKAAFNVVLALVFLGVSLFASAQLSPVPQKALQWLQAQVQGAALASEEAASGTSLQTKSEVVQTLRAISTTPIALASGVLSSDLSDTELLARRIMSGSYAGASVTAPLQQLATHQLPNGSIGSGQGSDGNILDTAWAVKAYAAAGLGNDPVAVKARLYLASQVAADGQLAPVRGAGPVGSGSQLYQMAMVSLALQTGADNSSQLGVGRLTSQLVSKQSADGSWASDVLVTARVLEAVASAKDLPEVRAKALSYLETRQSADGSWDGDAYLTAVALRGLTVQAPVAPVSNPPASGLDGSEVSSGDGLQTSTITAKILDKDSKQPLSGASVLIGSAPQSSTDVGTVVGNATTDGAGAFRIAGLAAGTYRMQVTLAGYGKHLFDIKFGAAQIVDFGQVLLAQQTDSPSPSASLNSSVTAVVIDAATRQPVRGVTVSLASVPAKASDVPAVVGGALTDDSGEFKISNVAAGAYRIQFSRAGYTSLTNDVQIGASQLVNFGQVPLAAVSTTGFVYGVVAKQTDGLPIAGAKVTLVVQGTTLVATADASGRFEFPAVTPGAFTITAQATGYQSASGSATLTAGQKMDFSPLLPATGQTGNVGGLFKAVVVSSVSETPLAGVKVTLTPSSAGAAITGLSDAQGKINVSGLVAGGYSLTYELAGYGSVAQQFVMPPNTNIDGGTIRLAAVLSTVDITGVVKTEAGAPIAGATVQVFNADSPAVTVSTGSDGRYSAAGIQPGLIRLRASNSGFVSKEAALNVAAGQVEQSFALAFVPPISPSIQISAVMPSAAVKQGEQATVSASVRNEGSVDVRVTIHLDIVNAKGDLVGAGTALGASGVPQSEFEILAGVSTDLSLVWNAVGAEPGTYRAWIRSFDVSTGVLLAQTYGAIELSPGVQKPDLVISKLTRGSARTDADQFNVSGALSVELLNSGNAAAPGGSVLLAFSDLNGNGVYDVGTDAEVGRIDVSLMLLAGEKVSLSLPVAGRLPFRDAPIYVQVDVTQEVAELNEGNNVASTADASVVLPQIGSFKPKLKWHWKVPKTYPTFNKVEMSPVVGRLFDTNQDGRVDQADATTIAFVSHEDKTKEGILRIVRGDTGEELLSVRDTNSPIAAVASIAVADLDRDGRPEIVAMGRNGTLRAYRDNGTRWWIAPAGGGTDQWAAPYIADIDGDGIPEIIAWKTVYNSNGTVRWVANTTYWGGSAHNSSIPIAADLFGQGKQNVIIGSAVFSPTGQKLWDKSKDCFTAVADFDRDGAPEIVCVATGRVELYSRNGAVLWSTALTGGGNGGPPTIADVDGDGVPEIGIAGSSRYVVLKSNGVVLWAKTIQDVSSSTTGSTVFDFDGDGRAEVLYSDEVKLRVFAGKDGAPLWEVPHSSVTSLEYPLVVDLDGDGHAEVVTVGSGNTGYNGVRVFIDEQNSWVNVRSVWNQHAYSITNILDDLTVPAQPEPSWQAHNTYRLNTTPGLSPTAVADGTIGALRLEAQAGGTSVVRARVGNAGALTLQATTRIALYSESPSAVKTLLAVRDVGQAVGEDRYVDVEWPAMVLGGASRLVAVLDDDGTGKSQFTDFDRSNNSVGLELVGVPVSLALAVTTDKPVYGADQPVLIAANLSNVSSQVAASAKVRLSVMAPDGKLVAQVGEFETGSIGASSQGGVQGIWNTAQWLSGAGYQAVAQLLDSKGSVISQQVTAFEISAGIASAQVRGTVRTDRLTYAPTDTVAVLDRVTNASQNGVLESLTVQTQISGSGGLLWSTSQDLDQLVGGALKEFNYRVPLSNVAPGAYSVVMSVMRQGETLTTAQSSFTVASTAETGVGLSGTLAALGSPVPAGDAIALSWSVTNRGNTDVNPASIRVRIVDPAAGVELGQVGSISLLLAAGGDVARSVSWTTSDALAGKTLVAVLTAEVAGRATDLAQTNFVVGPPPVKLDLNQSVSAGTGGQAKVLVLYDCESDYGWDLLAWLRLSYSHSCYAERKQFLSSYLSSLNVPHFITYDRTAFRKELRSGAYSTVWMLGGLPDCSGHLTNEVREAVNRGTTLLVDGGLAAFENHELIRLAGARYGGHIWLSSKTMDVTGAAYTPARLTTTGKPLRLSLFGGSVQASYANNLCYKVDYDGEDSTRHPTGAAYPAMVQNTYGRGRAVALGFDLISTLRNGGTDAGNWKKLVNETVGYLTPADEVRELVPGEYMSLATQVTNQASPADIRVRLGLPSSALVVGMNPAGTLEPGNKVLWQLNLPAGATQGLRAMVRAPLTSGGYSVSQEVSVVRNGQTLPYANSSQSMTVMDTVTPAKQALTRLKGLSVSLLEALTLLDAKVNLDYGISLFQQGRYHEAVEELGEAANSVRKLSADLKSERLAIDRLMQEAQYRWYLAQPK